MLLGSLTIPSSVTRILDNVFRSNEEIEMPLENIYYGGSETQWRAIHIGEGNDALSSTAIHYNSAAPQKPAQPTTPTVGNFTDVKNGDYYAEAAVWAYEKGMVSGSTFGGNTPCTRSMAVTYMWKAAGSPSAKAASFTDVSTNADYAQAVAWAVEQGVTAGTSATSFSPDSVCTRGQIVTFLYRGLAK